MAKPMDDNLFDLPYDTPNDADLFKKRPSSSVEAADIFTEPFEVSEDYLNESDMDDGMELGFSLVKPTGRMSMSQVFLLSAILFIGALLAYLMFGFRGPRKTLADVDASPNVPTLVRVAPVKSSPVTPNEPNETSHPFVVAQKTVLDGPVSLLAAEKAYQAVDLDRAYALYERLLDDLPAGQDNASLAAFLRLRMAFCLRGQGRMEAAKVLTHQLNQGHFPLIQAIIRYHQCVDRLRQHQYFPALQRGYQALSLVDCVQDHASWLGQFKQNCIFLVGQALTLQTLSQYDADANFPPTLWRMPVYQDPFTGLNEDAITQLIENGADAFRMAQVGPKIERSPGDINGQSWRVVCNGASVDQLLKRFSSHALLDLDWSSTVNSSPDVVDPLVRQRPVKLYLQDVSPQEVLVQAAGCARLFADLNEKRVVRISDPKPQKYSSLSHLRQLLLHEALVHWQRVTLSGQDLAYSPNAHFASALLLEKNQQASAAITEYQLLANRYSKSALSPYALLRSSELRTRLMDFDGARDDLEHLVELYPDVNFKSKAYLHLAQACWKAGQLNEAVTHFRVVYFMDATPAQMARAALGAGQCQFKRGQYQEAARWFTRYVDAAIRDPNINPAQGYLLLGRSLLALNRLDNAADALHRALTGSLGQKSYLEAMGYWVDLKIRQNQPVEALNLLVRDVPWNWSRTQINEITSLRARVLNNMGLTKKALTLLEQRLPFLNETKQRGRIYFQLARYYEAGGELNKALAFYGDVINTVEPGATAQQARLGLARISLHNQKYGQAVTLLQGVLADHPSQTIQQQAQQLLVRAYQHNDELDKAAQILLQQHLGVVTTGDVNEVKTQTPTTGKKSA